jgi:hypothetical protein
MMLRSEEYHGVEMQGVREYQEDLPAVFIRDAGSDRLTVRCMKAGYCVGPAIDLGDLLSWVKANRPELLGVRP